MITRIMSVVLLILQLAAIIFIWLEVRAIVGISDPKDVSEHIFLLLGFNVVCAFIGIRAIKQTFRSNKDQPT